jgi:hypothetical protein
VTYVAQQIIEITLLKAKSLQPLKYDYRTAAAVYMAISVF